MSENFILVGQYRCLPYGVTALMSFCAKHQCVKSELAMAVQQTQPKSRMTAL